MHSCTYHVSLYSYIYDNDMCVYSDHRTRGGYFYCLLSAVEKKTREVKNNIYKTMILNPLYDVNGSKPELGPVYECIKPSEPDSSYVTITIPSTRNDVSNSVMSSLAGPGPDYRNGPRTPKVKNQIAVNF